MAIAAVNASSSTASNWLKEAQDAIAASESPGGMMGALQELQLRLQHQSVSGEEPE